jgi:formyl-CoA transferase
VNRAPDLLEDPHVRAREAIVTVRDGGLGEIKMQSVFPKLSESPGCVRWTAPEQGAHNREVLGGLLGCSEQALADLAARGVI